MTWIKKLLQKFKTPEVETTEVETPEKQKQDREKKLQDLRKVFCTYTENPFSTNMNNFIQKIKIKESPTGWGVSVLTNEEVKKRLDAGICWLDYPLLNYNGTDIDGMTTVDLIKWGE